jgi:tRNA pseudouridine55 synthase
VVCSKGTYIRSLAFDIGSALNSGAYLKALRRTISGNYNIKDAKSIEEFQENLLSLQP